MTELTEIINRIRQKANKNFPSGCIIGQTLNMFADELQDFDCKLKMEYEHTQKFVRDAIIGYQKLFTYAPNNEDAGALMGRAAAANNWLKDHGFKEEELKWINEVLC